MEIDGEEKITLDNFNKIRGYINKAVSLKPGRRFWFNLYIAHDCPVEDIINDGELMGEIEDSEYIFQMAKVQASARSNAV